MGRTTDGGLSAAVADSWKMLNEIVVHVLDRLFFYGPDVGTYVALVWESWTEVPQVLAQIEHYVLRTLLAVSATIPGDMEYRFDEACTVLRDELEQLLNDAPNNQVVLEALRVLSSGKQRSMLKVGFNAGVYLVSVAGAFFHDPDIRSVLMDDEYARSRESTDEYLVDDGDFPGFAVESPVAFVLDLVRRGRGRALSTEAVQALSAWILLGCASCESSAC